MALLEIENLTVEFQTATGSFRAVDGVSLVGRQGEVLAIVGEVRLRQVGLDAGRHGPAALDGEGHRRPHDCSTARTCQTLTAPSAARSSARTWR